VEKLISKDYADEVRQAILDLQATPSSELGQKQWMPEGNETTHYSIIDKWGNAVSVTYTLNSFFGAKVIADHTGFFLNNEMDDFAIKPGSPNQFGLVEGEKNAIAAGKRPLSSMVPTIITKNKKVAMIIGSPGGPRIITATLLAIINVLDYRMNIQDAVNAPRFHHQWMPDTIYVESNTFSQNTQQELIDMGYQLTTNPEWGAVEAIYIHPDTKIIDGANDRRKSAGAAVGN
jgi:gamma-glutamyltranspeptidase/glutathione hydrolase